jgi:flagellar basal-body rod protein FlgG
VFSIDRDRQLLIGDNPVLGVEGPIFLEDSDIIIDGNGKIFNSQNQFMGQLDVVVIDDNSKLVKKGSTVFELAARANEFSATAEIKHRFLEESNVSQSNSMIEMIALLDSLRQFETHQKLIQMQDELNGKVINQVGAV